MSELISSSNSLNFGALRLANTKDIIRVGIVAASGFVYSPVFQWERPYHQEFPSDTLASYQQTFLDAINSPMHIVLVAVDRFDPKEGSKTKAVIPASNGFEAPAAGEKVIVGVACWNLQPGSERAGQFQDSKDIDSCLKIKGNCKRDKNFDHFNSLGQRVTDAEAKYFAGYSSLEMLVVHPAYWRRGHGTRLTEWGVRLSIEDNIRQGVIAVDMGLKIYRTLGFKHLTDVRVEGDDKDRNGVMVSVLEFDPQSRENGRLDWLHWFNPLPYLKF